MIYRSRMDNDQFIEDGMLFLRNKVDTVKLKRELDSITSDFLSDYAVDKMERTLKDNGFDVLWNVGYEGYRIV